MIFIVATVLAIFALLGILGWMLVRLRRQVYIVLDSNTVTPELRGVRIKGHRHKESIRFSGELPSQPAMTDAFYVERKK